MIAEYTQATRGPQRADSEHDAIDALCASVQAAGIEAERAAVVNLYVGVKSKPLTLLVGPAQGGKIAVMRCLAQVLTGGDVVHAQFMPGHAWWAGQSGNVALYTNAQTRLNTCKLLAMLEEAYVPENRDRMLVACLTRISPAELLTFFADTAFQLQHGEVMRLCAAHFTEPIPYPRNLLLTGTLDAPIGLDLEPDMLSMTNVVAWPANGSSSLSEAPPASPELAHGRAFLASMVRSEQAARLKLGRILPRPLAAFQPFASLEKVLQRHIGDLVPTLRNELLVYVANAHSCTGRGLFDDRPRVNLELALSWAVATVVVPRIHAPAPELRMALERMCPTAAQVIEELNA